jgi:hypothetical protein
MVVPFFKLVTQAVYDSDGNKLELDPKHRIYFLQNDLPGLTRRTTKDIKLSKSLSQTEELMDPHSLESFLTEASFLDLPRLLSCCLSFRL